MLDQFVYIFSHILGPLNFLHAKLCLPFGSMTSLHLHSSGWQRVEPSRRLQAMCKDIWSKRKPRDGIGCMETKNLSFCSWENPSVRSGLTFAILLPNGFNYLVYLTTSPPPPGVRWGQKLNWCSTGTDSFSLNGSPEYNMKTSVLVCVSPQIKRKGLCWSVLLINTT